MRCSLTVVSSPECGRSFNLMAGQALTVGRTESADESFHSDPQMSSSHFRIEFTGNACLIKDLSSTNGTFVNERQINEIKLEDGDKVRAGTTSFLVRTIDSTRAQVSSKNGLQASKDESTPSTAMPSTAPIIYSQSTSRQFAGIILVAESGPSNGRRSWIKPGQTLSFGSDDAADEAISDAALSSVHFSVSLVGNRVVLADQSNGSGTYVNGQKISTREIQSSDEIQAGTTRWHVLVGELASAKSSITETVTSGLTQKEFLKGIEDENQDVRISALEAAAWTRQPWLLDHCRSNCMTSLEAGLMYAILADKSATNTLCKLAAERALGADGFYVLGVFGYGGVVPTLIEEIESGETLSRIVAAMSFSLITGADIWSDRRFELADEEYADNLYGATFPDFHPSKESIKSFWHNYGKNFNSEFRWCQGIRYDSISEEALRLLDVNTLRFATIREHYHGRRNSSPAEILKLIRQR